jgi:hypothetical protein|tara:strand:- start:44 stop:556 length:513 start_codon:yes stop_codon:yes gene_type:complete
MVNLKKIWVENWLKSENRKQTFYDTYMNPETAPHTREFQGLCSRLEKYINNYLSKTTKKCLIHGNTLSLGEKFITNPANIIQYVFKNFKSKRCECCHSCDRNLDSAHTISSRPMIIHKATKQSYSELGYEDWVHCIIRFLELHSKYPVITLCKSCHRAMDKIDKRMKVNF